MKKHILKGEKRSLVGKKVKNLRKKGLLPANIYGKNIPSLSIEVDIKDFRKIYQEAGETGLIDLIINGETRPVLIHNFQLDPSSGFPLHADFYQVNLKEKVLSKVPVKIINEPEAVSSKIGVLLTLIDEVEIEALPSDLPEYLELDVKVLKEIDQDLKIKDLHIDSTKITVKSDPQQTLVRIGSLISDEAKKEAIAQEAAKASVVPESGEAEKKAEIPAEKPLEKEPPKKE